MNIVVASDENYVRHLETLLVSIGDNNSDIDVLKIYIFDGGIKKESLKSIKDYEKIYKNMKIFFYEMTEDKLLTLLGGAIEKDRSLSTYARIFIPEIIEGDRALYFDVDAIVLKDLNSLYNIDIEKYAIAGVRDTNPIERHRNVELKDTDEYINAGMILWNLRECRKINFTKLCLEFIEEHNGNVDAMDQGTINGVLGNKKLIKIIAPRYNTITSFYQINSSMIKKIYKLPKYYSDSELQEAKSNPVYVHFTPNMTSRPWNEHCKHPLKDQYWYYRNKTEYANEKLERDMRSFKLRILGWVYRNFPMIYYKLFVKK